MTMTIEQVVERNRRWLERHETSAEIENAAERFYEYEQKHEWLARALTAHAWIVAIALEAQAYLEVGKGNLFTDQLIEAAAQLPPPSDLATDFLQDQK